MAQSVIGALRVNLGIDSAQFRNGLKQAQTSLQKFGHMVRTALKAAAVAAVAALGALAVGIRNTINEADKMSKAAQSVGMATEELSRLSWAADLSGVSFEKLVGATGKLSKAIGDALRSKTSEQALAFKALGVSLTDAGGNMRATRPVIDEIANRFAAMKDGTEKTALAMAIFGRSGKELIPLLNQGADGLKAMGDEAERLGIVIDTQTGKRAEAFNDTLNRISKVFKGVTVQITSEILPALQAVADGFFIAGTENDRMKAIIKGSVVIFKGLATVVLFAVDSLRTFSVVAVGAADAIGKVLSGDFAGANGRMEESWKKTGEILSGFLDDVNEIWNSVDVEMSDHSLLPDGGQFVAGLGRLNRQAAAGADKIKKPLTETADKLSHSFESIGNSIGQAISRTRSWSQVLMDVLGQLARMALTSAGKAGPAGEIVAGILGGLTGFRNGGSFTVGGNGGIDSQLVAFKATPGETVDVRKPGQMRGSRAGGSVLVGIRVDDEGALQAYVARTTGAVVAENNRRTVPGIAQGAVKASGRKYNLRQPMTSV